jgi:hypothetical protein
MIPGYKYVKDVNPIPPCKAYLNQILPSFFNLALCFLRLSNISPTQTLRGGDIQLATFMILHLGVPFPPRAIQFDDLASDFRP